MRLTFGWQVSTFFGWGIYGLNLALELARLGIEAVSGSPFSRADVAADPLRASVAKAVADRSAPLWRLVEQSSAESVEVEGPLLNGLGRDLSCGPVASGRYLATRGVMVGVPFIEEAAISAAGRKRGAQYDLLIAGSGWNADVLARAGFDSTCVMQGVDRSIFHPAPKRGHWAGRFVVFAGGKLEYRKGQDLVLAAFREFRGRHPEALLVTVWASPWPWLARMAAAHPGMGQPPIGSDGQPDVVQWAVDSGIPADSVVALGPVPNFQMAHIIREADVAIFASRAEGGTNLPAMECMACGIPTIVSANTGHLDLLEHGAIGLHRQRPIERHDVDTTDWGESDVEEMTEALEAVYDGRATAPACTLPTWESQVGKLVNLVKGL